MAGSRDKAQVRRPKLPKLGESLRFYVEDTLRTRLKSPGVERYRLSAGGQGVRILLALGVIGAAVLALWWLGTR